MYEMKKKKKPFYSFWDIACIISLGVIGSVRWEDYSTTFGAMWLIIMCVITVGRYIYERTYERW